jgi:hypothetical protein
MKSKTVAAGAENIEHEMAESGQTQPELAGGPSLEEIRHRAYEMHLERGCLHGWDQDDWLQAERELLERYQARSSKSHSLDSGPCWNPGGRRACINP